MTPVHILNGYAIGVQLTAARVARNRMDTGIHPPSSWSLYPFRIHRIQRSTFRERRNNLRVPTPRSIPCNLSRYLQSLWNTQNLTCILGDTAAKVIPKLGCVYGTSRSGQELGNHAPHSTPLQHGNFTYNPCSPEAPKPTPEYTRLYCTMR